MLGFKTNLHDVDLGIKKSGTTQVSDDHFRGNFVGHLHHGGTKLVCEELDLTKNKLYGHTLGFHPQT